MQHLELTRDLAERFNTIYPDTFVIPEGYIPKVGARIMDLQNPESKMSKSQPQGSVALLEEPASIMKKFKRAVTDSLSTIKYEEGRYGINNLLSIYCSVTGKSIADAEAEFDGKGYGDFKKAVAEAVIAELEPVQAKYKELMADTAYLESVFKKGAEKAGEIAKTTLAEVYDKIGFVGR